MSQNSAFSCLVVYDLDLTLYDTWKMFRRVRERMIELTGDPKFVDETLGRLNGTGYSFAAHLHALGLSGNVVRREVARFNQHLANGNRFIFPGVLDGLERLKPVTDGALVTFGDPVFQMAKWEGATQLHPFIQAQQRFVFGEQTKGKALSDLSQLAYASVVYLEDSTVHLEEVARVAPRVNLVRMRWTDYESMPHKGDGRIWRVVRSFDEFVEYMEEEILS